MFEAVAPSSFTQPGSTHGAKAVASGLLAAEQALSEVAAVLDPASGEVGAAGEAWDEWVVALWTLRRRVDGLLGVAGARFESSGVWAGVGHRSTRAWWSANVTDGAAAASVVARAVEGFEVVPLFAAALTRGEVGSAHVKVAVEAHREFPRLSAALTEIEQVMLDYAGSHSPKQLRRMLFRSLHRIDPVAVDEADAARRERQAYLHVSTTLDGWARVDGSLPADIGQALLAVLAAARTSASAPQPFGLDHQPEPIDQPIDEPIDGLAGAAGVAEAPHQSASTEGAGECHQPSAAADSLGVAPAVPPRVRESQSNLAALAHVLAAAAAHSGEHRLADLDGARPVVHVLVSLADFMAARTESGSDPAEVIGFSGTGAAGSPGPLLSGEAARRLACDANVRRLLVNPAGRIVEYGEPARTVTRGMRLRIWHRDQHCRFPRCHAPIHHVHHIVHAAHGGPTHPANLIGLCYHHHHLVHEGGWAITGNPEQVAHFRHPVHRHSWSSAPPSHRHVHAIARN